MRFCVAAMLVACNAPTKPSDQPPKAVDPWATAGAPVETEADRATRMEHALAHIGELALTVAEIRHLPLEHEVARAYQTKDAMRAAMRDAVGKELPHSADTSAALFQIGLIPTKLDLADAELRALVTHGGAYYSSADKKFFLVIAPDAGLMLDGLVAHELVHALQDQHFGLDAVLPRGSVDADHLAARQFLVEGDATFTMFMFATARNHGTIQPAAVTLLRNELTQLMRLSPGEMLEQNALGISASADPELTKSIGKLDEVPLTLVQPMFDAYLYGADLVAATYQQGGWPAVDALYTAPPDSTEQALHPATKLFPKREAPIAVDLAAPADETLVADLVLGELQWQIYFALWAPTQKVAASEGWGGDRVIVTRRHDRTLLARIATVWDTRADADEFRAAYLTSLATRFPAGSGDATSSSGFTRGDDAGRIFVHQDGKRVWIVDGATDHDAIDRLR